MTLFGISTWSLHRCLGPLRWTVWNEESQSHDVKVEPQEEEVTLLELPAHLAREGYGVLEICHFHIPDTSETYLLKLKLAIETAGLDLHTILVDYGDLATPDAKRREADIELIARWIDVASIVGATAVRVVAGEQPATAETQARSIAGLRQLSEYGAERGVKVVTENFKQLTDTVAHWESIVEKLDGEPRTIVDFGNLSAEERLAGVSYGSSHAHSFHVKPPYHEDGTINASELKAMLHAIENEAPLIVINAEPGDMWEGCRSIKHVIEKLR
ncbi:sugar phosphate isomerase/epimerase family protein [Aureibacillus halotolerans]|uniref:Xylose isomerase-like TIM barrel protein n=1 Tax=Aureibacillus halotolerans TaxID=1508390 RepID=A0A4R6TZI0_9BACI|nr:TIM barrel protein [Aureibacillus halotolerans]TDQ38292.1 xylose isomerase-like TIM barrel protein [Aureibacillus halotolerans]